MGKKYKFKNVLFFDVETTGLNVFDDEIIKFSYVQADKNFNIKKSGNIFVNSCDIVVPQEVTKLTGITQRDVDGGINSNEFYLLLKELINEKTLIVSYNLNFSMSFILDFLFTRIKPEVIKNVYYLDLLDIFMKNGPQIKSFKLLNAVKFYNLEKKEFIDNIAHVYFNLFDEMKKRYELDLFYKVNRDDKFPNKPKQNYDDFMVNKTIFEEITVYDNCEDEV